MSRAAEDPIVRSSRREAIVALLLFSVALVYTITYCARYGYPGSSPSLAGGEFSGVAAADETAAEPPLTFVLGFPSWVFWGIVVPWGVCTVIACWLSFAFIQDEPLEEAAPPPDAPAAGGEAERER